MMIKGALLVLLFSSVFISGCGNTPSSEKAVSESKPYVVYCARHAEKVLNVKDPDLTAEGKIRAAELAKVLKDSNIEYVHSSDYVRTRKTAAPTATENGLTTELYDPGDLESLTEKIKEKGGTHLVVGHSNTTPSLVSLLGGEPGSPIDEASEYDRLYVVTKSKDGEVNSILMRYGAKYEKEASN